MYGSIHRDENSKNNNTSTSGGDIATEICSHKEEEQARYVQEDAMKRG